MNDRPRTFCWVWGLRGPAPQILFDDPRVGTDGVTILPGTEIKLDPRDGRSLDQLAAECPAPAVVS